MEYKAKAHYFGHKIYIDADCEECIWRYQDTHEPISRDDKRYCPSCKFLMTDDKHDPCINNLPGVFHACCGHGIDEPTSEPYASFSEHASDGITIYGEEALDFFKKHGKGPKPQCIK